MYIYFIIYVAVLQSEALSPIHSSLLHKRNIKRHQDESTRSHRAPCSLASPVENGDFLLPACIARVLFDKSTFS